MHGNDFINNNCQTDAACWYEMLRHFFGCQDSLTAAPPQDECPNFKVKEFFNWLCYIWRWDLQCQQMSNCAQCRANPSRSLTVGSTRGFVLEFKPMRLLIMVTLLISTFRMSQLQRSGSVWVSYQCMQGCCIGLRISKTFTTLSTWIVSSIQ